MLSRIFWAGDSTVKQNDYTSYPQTGIGQGLPLYLNRGIQIVNYAENGRSSKSFIQEGRLEQIEKEIKQGDFLFIQFGHNDEKADEERHTEPFTTYQKYLTQYVEAARIHKAHPVLITSLYRRLFDDSGNLLPDTHKEYPSAMKELGKALNVPVIDLCQLSFDLIQQAGVETSKRWFLHLPSGQHANFPEGKQDNSHLQYEGAVVFAELIARELRKLGDIYTKLLLPSQLPSEDPAMLKD